MNRRNYLYLPIVLLSTLPLKANDKQLIYEYIVSKANESVSKGGAVYTSSFHPKEYSEVIFSYNKAYTAFRFAYAYGGAIYSTSEIDISGLSNVDFTGNNATALFQSTSSDATSYGGSIYAEGSISFTNNTSITFDGNYAYAGTYYHQYANYGVSALGGAIYSTGSVNISGNDSVIFSRNYTNCGNSVYKLEGIYVSPQSSNCSLILAAKSGGHITFHDSVYMGNYSGLEVSLNADYTDADGVSQKATGDIIFSGKYTEDHLKEIKGGTEGTASEITNSRTSELLNTVNLYGGTLRVEDKAVLKTHAINVTDGSNATMKVTDAEVNTSSYDITVNKTGTLEIAGTDGSSKITAKNINIEEGATLSLKLTEVVTENVAIALSPADSVSIYNDKIAGIVISSNLNIAGGATLKADGAHLSMDGGILNFLATTENKTNLVLTFGAEYDPNSQIMLFSDVDTVKFLQDSITATSNSAMVSLNASDYFTGDWVNDKTTLVYDSGNIYVSGVNVVIPEPATTTLSLLALAALAARRRRK